MTNFPWFRVYSEIVGDSKIQRISKKTGKPEGLVLAIWVTLLAWANKSKDRGRVEITEGEPYGLEDLTRATGFPRKTVQAVLLEMINLRMVDFEEETLTFVISNWSNRQFPSDNSTERVKKHRLTNRETLHETLHDTSLETSHESTMKRFGNAPDTDTDIDTELDTDTEAEEEEERADTRSKEKQKAAAAVFKLYETEIGVITSTIADDIKSALEDYPAEWFERAFQESARQNKRSWKYALAILKRWKVEGFQSNTKPKDQPKYEKGYKAINGEMVPVWLDVKGVEYFTDPTKAMLNV